MSDKSSKNTQPLNGHDPAFLIQTMYRIYEDSLPDNHRLSLSAGNIEVESHRASPIQSNHGDLVGIRVEHAHRAAWFYPSHDHANGFAPGILRMVDGLFVLLLPPRQRGAVGA
jgi:hypothetical protein